MNDAKKNTDLYEVPELENGDDSIDDGPPLDAPEITDDEAAELGEDDGDG